MRNVNMAPCKSLNAASSASEGLLPPDYPGPPGKGILCDPQESFHFCPGRPIPQAPFVAVLVDKC